MCNSKLHDFLCALPKCEHHIHIEGTLDPDLLFTLAHQNSVSLPSDDPAFASASTLRARYANFTSLDDFLHYYFIGFSVLNTASDFEALTYSYLQRVASQNVRHVEIFFDPQVHIGRGISYDLVLSGLNAARIRAVADLPDLTVMFIPCIVRHLPVSSAFEMVSQIIESGHLHDGTVSGLGMSSTEVGMHPSLFTSIYDAAKLAGVKNLTAHFGEEGPSDYVSAALSELNVVRIDHGRRAAETPSLLLKLAEERIMLTLCPVSNVVLKGVQDIAEIPIRHFLDAGVPFSINSDDPAYFGADILANYCAVQEAFQLSIEEWETISKAAIEGSWCSSQRKLELESMVDTAINEWRNACF